MSLSPERRKLLELLRREQSEISRFARIEPRRDRSTFPMTYSQNLAWFAQREGACSFDHPATAFWVEGELETELIAKSVERVIARYDVLRARFVQIDGAVVQQIREEPAFELHVHDLEGTPQDERRARALELALSLDERPFDLANDPMVRTLVVRLSPREHLFAVIINHIAFDGYSIPSFLGELWTIYDALREGSDPLLAPPSLQLADYADWQQRFVRSPAGEKQIAYWKRTLAGARPLDLPLDGPRPRFPDHLPFARHYPSHGAVARASGDLLSRIRARAREARASTYMVLLAGLASMLRDRCGQEDISIFSPYSHRDRAETRKLIGYAANPLIMRIDLNGKPTPRDVLDRARTAALETFSNPDVPLCYGREVHRDLSFAALAPSSLFRVSLNYLPIGLSLPTPRSVKLEDAQWPSNRTRIDLAFFVEENPDQIAFYGLANAELFQPSTLAAMTEDFLKAVEVVALHS